MSGLPWILIIIASALVGVFVAIRFPQVVPVMRILGIVAAIILLIVFVVQLISG